MLLGNILAFIAEKSLIFKHFHIYFTFQWFLLIGSHPTETLHFWINLSGMSRVAFVLYRHSFNSMFFIIKILLLSNDHMNSSLHWCQQILMPKMYVNPELQTTWENAKDFQALEINVVLNINVFCSQTLKGLKASESKLYEKINIRNFDDHVTVTFLV